MSAMMDALRNGSNKDKDKAAGALADNDIDMKPALDAMVQRKTMMDALKEGVESGSIKAPVPYDPTGPAVEEKTLSGEAKAVLDKFAKAMNGGATAQTQDEIYGGALAEDANSPDALKRDAERYRKIRKLAADGKIPTSWQEGYQATELDDVIDRAEVFL